MTATVKGIVDKEKSVQDSKTEKLRKLREARDAASPAPGTAVIKPAKKRKTSRRFRSTRSHRRTILSATARNLGKRNAERNSEVV